jgi:hypothetical protein
MDELEGSKAADAATMLSILTKNLGDLAKAASENADASNDVRVNTLSASMSLKELVEYVKEGGQDQSGMLMSKARNAILISPPQQPNMSIKKNK